MMPAAVSGAGGGGSGGGLNQLTDALFGEKSLKERFGDLDGRELQARIWEAYMAP